MTEHLSAWEVLVAEAVVLAGVVLAAVCVVGWVLAQIRR